MSRKEFQFVRNMFDRIAPHYDFLNRLLSLRQDVYWRTTLTASLDLASGARVLDAACGTADVGIEIRRQYGDRIDIVGIDFAPEMLRMAKLKTKDQAIGLAAADVFQLPLRPGGFDAITMAFGIRNIQDKTAALKKFWEQLKPGGRLAILELGTPARGVPRFLYLSYFNRLLPFIGRFFSRHSFAYSYLPESVSRFPAAPEFARLMHLAGFRRIRFLPLTLGITVLFVADKPE